MDEPREPHAACLRPLACQSRDRGKASTVTGATRPYTEVLGGRVVFGPEPVNVALANSWIVINAGGGPTDDKPTVTLETPSDPDRVSSFLNIRVKDSKPCTPNGAPAVPNS
jgi:hypothetical protein